MSLNRSTFSPAGVRNSRGMSSLVDDVLLGLEEPHFGKLPGLGIFDRQRAQHSFLDVALVGAEDADRHSDGQALGKLFGGDSLEGPHGRGQAPALDVTAVVPFIAHVDPFVGGLAGTVAEGEFSVDGHAGHEHPFRRAKLVNNLVALLFRRPRVRVSLLHLDVAVIGGAVNRHLVAVMVDEAGVALEDDRSAWHGAFDGLQIVGRELVGMGQAAHRRTRS